MPNMYDQETWLREVGLRIRRAREECKLSQEELAERSGVGRLTISKLERGAQGNIKTTTALSLSRALNVSVGYLLCE